MAQMPANRVKKAGHAAKQAVRFRAHATSSSRHPFKKRLLRPRKRSARGLSCPQSAFPSCSYRITCFVPAKPAVLRGPGPCLPLLWLRPSAQHGAWPEGGVSHVSGMKV